jgi:hypothetical protein
LECRHGLNISLAKREELSSTIDSYDAMPYFEMRYLRVFEGIKNVSAIVCIFYSDIQ